MKRFRKHCKNIFTLLSSETALTQQYILKINGEKCGGSKIQLVFTPYQHQFENDKKMDRNNFFVISAIKNTFTTRKYIQA